MSSFDETIDFAHFQSGVGTVGTTPSQVLANVTDKPAYKGVWISNTHANNVLYIGDAGVTTTNGFGLPAGQTCFIQIKQVNQFYVIAAVAATTYSWCSY